MSEFYKKLFGHLLPVRDLTWIETVFRWMIDSKYRTLKRLDKFLAEPLQSPQEPLIDYSLKNLWNGKNEREIVINVLKYVHGRVNYVPDIDQYKRLEYWANPYETWLSQEGDCDDINSLIYHLCRLCGIPQNLLWNCIGVVNVNGQMVGHYWLVYLDTDYQDLYVIDATYEPDFAEIVHRSPFKLSPIRYMDIWYLWNEDIILKPR